MEPNNIENKFREKLNSREIQPSDKAWDRLDAMLTLNEKPKRNYRWMYFAASILGFILIATVFFSQTEEVIDAANVKLVIEENNEEVKDSNLEKALQIPLEKNTKEAVAVGENEQKKQSLKSNVVLKKQGLAQTALVSNITKKTVNNLVQNTSSKETIDVYINTSNSAVKVDAETLLASIEAQNTKSSATKNSVAIKVSPNDLLTQVDSELEQSFREKVIQSVNKKYHEVKVAFANRNLK